MGHAIVLGILLTIITYLAITVANYIATGQTTSSYITSACLGLAIGSAAYYIVRIARDS